MANNAKLERISVALARKLNDAATSAGVVITTGDQDGVILSANQRMDYINRAMFKLVGDVWEMANQRDWKNAKQIFAGVFPELVVTRNVTTTSAGGPGLASAYYIATPNLDYFQLLEAVVDGMQAEMAPSYLYLKVKSGRTPQIKGSSTIPMVVEIDKCISFLPDGVAFQNKTANLTFLRQPLDKTSGNFLAMNSSTTEDSPFLDQWNEKITNIAEQLFRIDAKE